MSGRARSRGVTWRGHLTQLRNGLPIEVDPRDMIGREILRQGCWEWETYHFLETWLRPGMTIVDAGANIGQYSMLASERVGPEGTVHAFEPHPTVYRVLGRNLRRAGCANVVAHRLALGRDPGSRELFMHPIDNIGAASLRPRAAGSADPRVPVTATTLDAYVDAKRLRRVDLVKIDVEGAEIEVLDGAAGTLDANPDIVLVVEFLRENARRFGHTVEDLEERLRGWGFRLFSITARGLVPYTPVADLAVNVVASRRLPTILHGLPESLAALLLMRLADAPPPPPEDRPPPAVARRRRPTSRSRGAAPARYVISRRAAGLGDHLVNLVAAWRFATHTGRTLVADWRFTSYLDDGRAISSQRCSSPSTSWPVLSSWATIGSPT